MQPPHREGDLSVHSMSSLFLTAAKKVYGISLPRKIKCREGWGGSCGCDGTHTPMEHAQESTSIASTQPLDSILEPEDLPTQLKPKLLRAPKPGYFPYVGKYQVKGEPGPPQKKPGVMGRKRCRFITLQQTKSTQNVLQAFNVKTGKGGLRLVSTVSSQRFTHGKLDPA